MNQYSNGQQEHTVSGEGFGVIFIVSGALRMETEWLEEHQRRWKESPGITSSIPYNSNLVGAMALLMTSD